MPDRLDAKPCVHARRGALHRVGGVDDPAHERRPAPLPIRARQSGKDEWFRQRERLSDLRRQRRRAPGRGFELPRERATLGFGSRAALGLTGRESSAQRDRIFLDRPDGVRPDARSDRARAPHERSDEKRGAAGVRGDLHGAPIVPPRADARASAHKYVSPPEGIGPPTRCLRSTPSARRRCPARVTRLPGTLAVRQALRASSGHHGWRPPPLRHPLATRFRHPRSRVRS